MSALDVKAELLRLWKEAARHYAKKRQASGESGDAAARAAEWYERELDSLADDKAFGVKQFARLGELTFKLLRRGDCERAAQLIACTRGTCQPGIPHDHKPADIPS